MVFHFLPLRTVAGKTGCGEVCSKFHIERCMGIGVAGIAAADLIMGFPGMAFGAGRDDLFLCDHRGVSLMAAQAGDRCLVLCSFAVHYSLNA